MASRKKAELRKYHVRVQYVFKNKQSRGVELGRNVMALDEKMAIEIAERLTLEGYPYRIWFASIAKLIE